MFEVKWKTSFIVSVRRFDDTNILSTNSAFNTISFKSNANPDSDTFDCDSFTQDGIVSTSLEKPESNILDCDSFIQGAKSLLNCLREIFC